MVTFVIFWAALFAIVFFVAGTFFKALSSAVNALLNTIGIAIVIGVLMAAVVLAVAMLYEIVDAIATGSIGQLLGMLVLMVIEIAVIGALFGGIGALLLAIAIKAAEYIITAVSFVLDKMISICDWGYTKCLTAIFRRTEKRVGGANG